MEGRKLTDKEEKFCLEYLVDLNATQAAIRAGFSEASARQTASRMLSKANIQARVGELKSERSEETKIDAAWVLKRLADEAEADVADLYDDDGNLLPVKKWPKIWRQGLVQGIEVEEIFEGTGRVRKIKLSERVRRIELIGKHVNVQAFKEQIDVKVTDDRAERLARARQRKAADAKPA